ncbi:hypothetical protein AB9Q52_013350 [Pantoea vagans]|uniref:hypothetical protein n=1 Tax=Pantoea vagans TaxID=470934 RepID=UPI0035113569
MNKYPHGIKLAAVCNAIDAYKAHEDEVPEIGILKAFEVLLADSDLGDKLQALAAENAALKESREVLAKNSLEACNEVYCAGYRNTALHDGLMESTGNRNAYPNPIRTMVDEATKQLATPATDAYLNSVRAEAISNALNSCSALCDPDCVMDAHDISHEDAELRSSGAAELSDELLAYANRLRAGKDGE